jgi:nucleolar GTP-binding protein
LEEKQKEKKPTLKDLQEQYGGAGVFSYPLQEHFLLDNEEWKYDAIPEILNGKNVFDFVDPEIERKILLLEEEQS